MASTAVIPTSLVELTISCRGLRDCDILSKSDPFCVVYHKPFGTEKWTEYKRTECIDNTLNPDFAVKIPFEYNFEILQYIKFSVYDMDSDDKELWHHDFLGEFECTLAQLVSAQTSEKPLHDRNNPGLNCGTIKILAEELSSCKEELLLQLTGNDFDVKQGFFDCLTSVNPFLEFYKSTESGHVLVHRTDPVKNTRSPVFREFTVPLRSFCNGDYDMNLKVVAKSFISNGSHKTIGDFNTTVRALVGPKQEPYLLINEEKKKKKGNQYLCSGFVEINKALKRKVYTFLDYIKGGTEICAYVGIDFTASNGNPQEPSSLHYVHCRSPNQYASAIRAVVDIIEDYDDDKYFPVLGFGARLPPDYDKVSHEFFVNGDPNSPFCYRVQGVLDAYHSCLNTVQLYGPTNFAPIIRHVANFASSCRGGDKYFILLMITDGIITDMPQTKEAIVRASNLPLSIIIIGVGKADFSAMEELDGDNVRLSSNGKYAERDIVQFVPFQDFIKGNLDPGSARYALAKEVLAEVPDQLMSYMKANGISPKSPANPVGVGISSGSSFLV